ncbi:MAG: hypothetical protein B6D58_05090 [candidate division Zixibacteria bacterium 4484_95]|nr:MAG: hypothetical protein B6D58_05090 [candidate division Zixibacteria bacterium 4484_95]RKX19234.1 MAG: inositol monophosphatase [candidate division Zixibacteria bacterium]
MDEYIKRLITAEHAARQAGKYLIEVLPEKRDIDKKGIINLVTEVDRNSEKLIHEIITGHFPEDGFLAEEGTKSSPDKKGGSEFTWIVDPLDGTTNYAHRLPIFCVSIAIVKKGIPCVGCIYNPVLDECFTAQKEKGAFLNGKPIRVSTTDKLIDSLLATGFPYDIRESDDDNLDNFAMFYKKAQAVRRAGSAALDIAYLACGRFDGFWEFKLSSWDIAAGIVIVEEAGGVVSKFNGEPVDIFKGEILASNGLIHSQMLKILEMTKKQR